jgi:uncharacterized membrane protein
MANKGRPQESAWIDRGEDLSRVLALSDGIFAFALTLLAVDLDVPQIASNLVAEELPGEILGLLPKFMIFALAFYLVMVKWMAHRRIFKHVVRYDSTLIWFNNLFLLFIAFMPVPTSVLGRYPQEPSALIFFGIVQIVTSFAQWGLWSYVTRGHRFVDASVDETVRRFFTRSYVWQILALAAFTAFALVNVWVALALLVLVNVLFQIYVSRQRRLHDAAGTQSR